jgi:predicted amidohydrolase
MHAESANYQAGAQVQLADLGAALSHAKLGLSICYDVRFAGLYRRLGEAGADIISVPSAFTRPTGAAHWHILLRARAIETGCFILAPAQIGHHENGRETYGHSLMIDPWGRILAEAEAGDDVIYVDLDLGLVAKARQQIPALQHGRDYVLPDGSQAHD